MPAVIVEDGTGLSTANSYVSVDDADTYFLEHGDPAGWTGSTTAQKETAVIVATQYIDALMALRWKGIRSNENQALAWPRSNVRDYDGFTLVSNAIPTKLIHASVEAAVRHRTETNGLLPDVATPGTIKSTSDQIGDLKTSVSYAGASQLPRFSIVLQLLRDLVNASNVVERA